MFLLVYCSKYFTTLFLQNRNEYLEALEHNNNYVDSTDVYFVNTNVNQSVIAIKSTDENVEGKGEVVAGHCQYNIINFYW